MVEGDATIPTPLPTPAPVTSQLDQLRQLSAVVADTGDIEAIARFKPMDATTNPSLLLKAAGLPAYASHIDAAVAAATGDDKVGDAGDRLAVAIGGEILKLYVGGIRKAQTMQEFADLTESIMTYMNRLHGWVDIAFPWGLVDGFKRVNPLQRIADRQASATA